MRGSGPLSIAVLVACAAAAAGCGKKGPPLAPLIRVPSAVEQLDARRVGNDIYLTLTVPATNIDKSTPADVARIEVYGYTGVAAPPRARFLDVATLVGTVQVAPPPPPTPGATAGPAPEAAVQGAPAGLRETLTAETLVAKPIPPPPGRTAVVAATPATPGTLRRFYTAVAFSDRGRNGPPGAFIELPLTVLPEPPSGLLVAYSEGGISLTWQPSGGLVGFLLDQALPVEAAPFDEVARPQALPSGASATMGPATAADVAAAPAEPPPGPTTYNVYREVGPDPLALPGADAVPVAIAGAARPAPINATPLATLEHVDALVLDERERCYTVRAVRDAEPNAVEGEPSSRVCVTPFDIFPPSAPTGLSAIAAEGVISLIWEPNAEADLAGYLILRGEAGSATLARLSDVVTLETRFTDRGVQPGVRYVYAVVALDGRLPVANVSPESGRVEATAR